jgi:hypothetical protein
MRKRRRAAATLTSITSNGRATAGLLAQLENLKTAVDDLENQQTTLTDSLYPFLTQTETEAGSIGSVREAGNSQAVDAVLDLIERVHNVSNSLANLESRIQK